ncbi:hypothetical protein Clacol_008837 [Clathrus columnatus]|uniref:Copper-fist domain-containing protein n=1 Tax=Clathrus columnatus TaxID=1419009 RepID=A0AAV5ALC5_9AGAM|nr:hypothetical protein Clacol_008837 [Clathrus columnatus]
MVILNGLKYACETCIKGHRSSACSHTDRALFEIKKKGRPITQCEHCRHLRKTKQVHVKCLCGDRPTAEKSNNSRAKLKLPTSATIHLDPNDPTHATITTVSHPPRTKLKPKSKGCYEHSPSASMILFTGESCPYSCTTCTECNGLGFTSHLANAFLVPPHPNDNWNQSSNSIVSTTALVPTPATSISGTSFLPSIPTTKNTAAIRSCCGGPCKCSICNCSKLRDGDEHSERIGFAVSGERGGCCTDVNPRTRHRDSIKGTDNMSDIKQQKLEITATSSDYPVENASASLSLQGNPTTTQIQSHSIEIPRLNI